MFIYYYYYFILSSRIVYKITILTFFKQPLFMCSYNDGNVKLVITHLQLLLVSSNLNIRYYNIQVVFHHHLPNYCSYSFHATSFHISILIDIMLIFMLSSIFIYKITVFTFFKLPPFICLYNDLTCITHLSLLLFSSNLYR